MKFPLLSLNLRLCLIIYLVTTHTGFYIFLSEGNTLLIWIILEDILPLCHDVTVALVIWAIWNLVSLLAVNKEAKQQTERTDVKGPKRFANLKKINLKI